MCIICQASETADLWAQAGERNALFVANQTSNSLPPICPLSGFLERNVLHLFVRHVWRTSCQEILRHQRRKENHKAHRSWRLAMPEVRTNESESNDYTRRVVERVLNGDRVVDYRGKQLEADSSVEYALMNRTLKLEW